MPNYNKITADAFSKLQLGAGIVCRNFTPANPGDVQDADIMFATTGGVSFAAKPTYTDYGEDVDNCPTNVKELKRVDGWEASLSGTALTIDTASAKQLVGPADAADNKITPRDQLKDADFADIWWVGEMSDGGVACVHLLNALSTDGFSLQTTNKGKGQFAFAFTGHYSIKSQDTPPFEIYLIPAASVNHAAIEGQAVVAELADEQVANRVEGEVSE